MENWPGSVYAAALEGDRKQTLIALRDTLAEAIDGCESKRDLAALSRQLTDVLAQIDAVPDPKAVSAVDDLASRRAARIAGTADPALSEG